MEPVKPGIYSSEFWSALIHMLFTVLVTGGLVTLVDAKTLEGAITAAVAAATAFASSAYVVVNYIKSRTTAKIVASAPRDILPYVKLPGM